MATAPARLDGNKGSCKKDEEVVTKLVVLSEVQLNSAACGAHVKSKVALPAKNTMSSEWVDHILRWKKPPTANRKGATTDELHDDLVDFQQRLQKELDDKGYVEVLDDHKERITRANDNVYAQAYFEMYGSYPPPELCSA